LLRLMDNFVAAKAYGLAAWAEPVPQPAHRDCAWHFPKVSGNRWPGRFCATLPVGGVDRM